MFDFTFEKLDSDVGEAVPMFSGYGRLTLSVNGLGIWCDNRGVEITGIAEYWDSLLDHLARCWHSIGIEEPYPLRFNPESPMGFLEDAMAELRNMGLSKNAFVEEEVKIFAFSDRHNLAAGMPNLFLPPLFILREGNDVRIVTETDDVRLPFGQVMKQLEALGSAIADAIHSQSPRGGMILDAWSQRDHALPVNDALAMLIGVPPSLVGEIAANDDPSEVFGYTGWDSPSPRVLAARMTQHCLEPKEIRMVMDRIARASLGKTTPEFTNLRREAGQQLESLASERHFRQGYELAKWLRSTLSVSADRTVDPDQLLRSWGVTVEPSRELPDEIDAVALWEGSQACVIIKPLPSVEILGGRMPVLVEKRANACAAELLLPRTQVEQVLPESLSADAVTTAMNGLTERFDVSRTLTGHQMENLLKDTGKLTSRVKGWIEKAMNQGSRDPANSRTETRI
ncbi:MAG: hypothetical protein HW380_1778 [Magnetococcales bacterium]|nr:hypothetical protein [Magnetococcales bacterium]